MDTPNTPPPAWRVSLQTDRPLCGDPWLGDAERLHIADGDGWRASSLTLGRYGDLRLSLRSTDTSDSAELAVRLTDPENCRDVINGAVVRFVERAASLLRTNTDRAAARHLLEQVAAALEVARAELAAADAAALAPEVA